MTALRVLVPFALGFFFSYAVRNVNAIIAPDLTAALDLSPADLGLLSSAYFLTFAAFQLPLGVLLDRYGPRRVETVLLLVAAGGSAAFALGSGMGTLLTARALIGLGTSACLMAAFKAYTQWFPPERLPLVNGITMAVGGLGALTVTAPVEALLQHTDWRGVLLILAGAATLCASLIFLAVPRHADERGEPRERLLDQIAGLREVTASAYFWRLAPMSFVAQSAFLSIQGLWAGPWMLDVAGLERTEAAANLLYITVSMIAGFLAIGALAERLERIGITTTAFATFNVVVFTAALAAIALEAPLPPLVPWCAFGFFGGVGVLLYPVLTRRFRPDLAGRVITSVNLLAFGGAFALQWGIGVVIELWPVDAAGHFHPAGYRWGLLLTAGLLAASVAWLVYPRKAQAA